MVVFRLPRMAAMTAIRSYGRRRNLFSEVHGAFRTVLPTIHINKESASEMIGFTDEKRPLFRSKEQRSFFVVSIQLRHELK